jgi:hypothetical protein
MPDLEGHAARTPAPTSPGDLREPQAPDAAGCGGIPGRIALAGTEQRSWQGPLPTGPAATTTVTFAVRSLMTLTVVVLALFPIVRFMSIALARIRYPFELEWMEGGIIDHVRVLLSGQPLYREPSLAFTPFIYTPGYYYASALFSWLFGVGFFAARLVSLLSILGCMALLVSWVRRETGDLVAGVLGAGLFAATFAKASMWFDIARVDSLFLALLLTGYTLARFGGGLPSAVAAALFLGLAVLTKQVGIALALPALLYVRLRSRRRGIWSGVTFVAFVAGTFAWLELRSHGWFSFYVFRVPGQHDVHWSNWKAMVVEHFWSPLIPMTLAGVALVLGVVGGLPRASWLLHATWISAAFVTALSSILHTGGYSNVLMPAYLVLAVAAAIVFGRVRRRWPLRGRLSAARVGLHLFAIALILIQLQLLSYNPQDALPSQGDVEANRQLFAAIKASPGPVWMVSSGFYPSLSRRAPVTAHALAIADVFKAHDEDVKARFREQIVSEIRSKKFRTVVLDRANGFLPADIVDEIKRVYHFQRRIFSPDQNHGWPKVGAWVRPDELWEP